MKTYLLPPGTPIPEARKREGKEKLEYFEQYYNERLRPIDSSLPPFVPTHDLERMKQRFNDAFEKGKETTVGSGDELDEIEALDVYETLLREEIKFAEEHIERRTANDFTQNKRFHNPAANKKTEIVGMKKYARWLKSELTQTVKAIEALTSKTTMEPSATGQAPTGLSEPKTITVHVDFAKLFKPGKDIQKPLRALYNEGFIDEKSTLIFKGRGKVYLGVFLDLLIEHDYTGNHDTPTLLKGIEGQFCTSYAWPTYSESKNKTSGSKYKKQLESYFANKLG